MFYKNSLIVLTLIFASTNLMFADTKPLKPLCTQQQCSKGNSSSCTCYCSVKCGPRKIEADDTLIWKYGRCWCKQRDLDLYEPNKCAIEDAKSDNYGPVSSKVE